MTLATIAGLITALGGIGGLAWGIWQWFHPAKSNDEKLGQAETEAATEKDIANVADKQAANNAAARDARSIGERLQHGDD